MKDLNTYHLYSTKWDIDDLNSFIIEYYIDSHYSLLFESRVFKGPNIYWPSTVASFFPFCECIDFCCAASSDLKFLSYLLTVMVYFIENRRDVWGNPCNKETRMWNGSHHTCHHTTSNLTLTLTKLHQFYSTINRFLIEEHMRLCNSKAQSQSRWR